MNCKCGEKLEEKKGIVNLTYSQGSSIKFNAKVLECHKCKSFIIEEVD